MKIYTIEDQEYRFHYKCEIATLINKGNIKVISGHYCTYECPFNKTPSKACEEIWCDRQVMIDYVESNMI